MRIWQDSAHEGFTSQDLANFAIGYGIDVETYLQTLAEIQLLNSLDIVRWAIDRRPDLLSAKVESSREVVQRSMRRPDDHPPYRHPTAGGSSRTSKICLP